MTCCNNTIEIKTGKQNGKTLFYAECPTCGKKFKSENKNAVEDYFAHESTTTAMTTTLAPIPKKPADIIEWGNKNLPALINQSAHFIDKPATKRMIEKNIRYVSGLVGKSWDKIWSSPDGQESISYALSESLYYAAVLPDMGSIVPFGTMAEFIPSVECYKFALETGRNAPFSDIQIDLIHANDKTENYQKDGNFFIEIKRGIPRGDVIAVVVSGVRSDTGKRIGEVYDVDRLIEKAKHHSPSYRNYLIDKAAFDALRVENKLKKDTDGRLYFEKQIPKADGGTWTKKIYESDIANPYDGPDRPEMLRKAAGKSFFRPYMKTRNASAMADEWDREPIETRDDAADHVLSRATGQFANISDGEIVDDEDNTKAPIKSEPPKQEKEKPIEKLFDDDEDL